MIYQVATTTKKLKRSIRCNGAAIRLLRQQQGLRQSDLARLAGYSVRLIGKAEAGKALSIATIETLAEALSIAGALVTPEQLVLDLKRIGQEYLRLRRLADAEAMGQFLAPNFSLSVCCDIAEAGFASGYHGQSGLEAYHRRFHQMLRYNGDQETHSSQEQIFESSNALILWSHNTWFIKSPAAPALLVTRLTFADGKLTHQKDLYTTLDAID